jgi:hypothetical protein
VHYPNRAYELQGQASALHKTRTSGETIPVGPKDKIDLNQWSSRGNGLKKKLIIKLGTFS